MEQEYLSNKIDMFDPETGKRLGDLSTALQAARLANKALQKQHLKQSIGAVSFLHGRYETRLTLRPELKVQFQPILDRVLSLATDATTELTQSSPDLTKALGELNRAQAILEAIRIAVDGKVIVRFFDGAGNEVDVTNRASVIFVATDVSRFSQAIRELAEEKEFTQDVLLTVMGPRIQEAKLLEARRNYSDNETTAAIKALDALLEGAKQLDHSALEARILDIATLVAGTPGEFGDANQIRGYVRGKEGR